MRGRVAPDLTLDEVCVHGSVLHERRGDDTGQHVVDRRLHVAFGDERERLLARGDELGCVGGHGELEDRRLPGLG